MGFYRDTVRTAIKPHICKMCGDVIMTGEQYHDKAGNEPDGMWYTKECGKCQSVIDEFFNSNNDYIDEGNRS